MHAKYNIEPFIGVGNLLFSDTRPVIRHKIGGSYKNGEYAIANVFELFDYFKDADIKVLYDRDEQVNALEFYRGEVLFMDKDILSDNYADTQRFFLEMDPDLQIDDFGFTSFKFGVGIGHNDLNAPPDSVIVFRSGYYSNV